MKLQCRRSFKGFTLAEVSMALGIGTLMLAGFTTASVALQKSFVAIEDYAKGVNDQTRISDYLALDMRRALEVISTIDPLTKALTVTITEPNYYAGANTAYDPHIVKSVGWPKKHHHHKHQSIIINQLLNYGPSDDSVPTITVTYRFDNGANSLTRTVTRKDAVSGASGGGTKVLTNAVFASDVQDFNVKISDVDETATTQITFQPRFRTTTAAEAQSLTGAARLGSTYIQTTLTRNTR